MPNFAIQDRSPPRLPGDFDLKPVQPHVPNAAELVYLAKLEDVVGRMIEDAASDGKAFSEPVAAARSQRRSVELARLRRHAEEFAGGRMPPERAADLALVAKGRYLAGIERVSGARLFSVKERLADPDASDAKPGAAIDLDIHVADGLPKPEDVASPEKQALFVAIYGTLTIIKSVCREMGEADNAARRRRTRWFGANEAWRNTDRASRLLDEYVRKLAGIGRLGLSGPHTALAALALVNLKAEFVAHEASRIKNAYAKRLGVIAALTMAVLLAAYFAIKVEVPGTGLIASHASFLLAGIGAALGAWLSFSIRNVALNFEQLATIENDLLGPGLRILFVLGLTFAAYLLFWTDAVGVSAGDLKITSAGLKENGTFAILVGIFCGLSERALATAISGRSAAFVGGIAGGPTR